MTRRKIPKTRPGEVPWATRIELAVADYNATYNLKGWASFRAVGRSYDVAWSTVRDRVVKGRISRDMSAKARQRLSPAEEDALEEYCLQLERWGCPARIIQLRKMAEELLRAKGDIAPLGGDWQSKFLNRRPKLKSAFTTPQNRNRQLSEDPDILEHWFKLYAEVVKEHGVHPEDTYNMDEKGVALGVIPKQRCIVSKTERRPKSTQDGNREWTSLVECISLKGKVLSPWIIFKGKIQQKRWTEKLRAERAKQGEEWPGHCSVSENGWTDNELALNWLKECFEPETAQHQKGGWRLLLWDGHSSHISTAAITFCLEKKIIPLCLPPHTTHLLQPCDVGLFGPEATYYKHEIATRCKPGAYHSVDKELFIEVYCLIRPKALSQQNIEHAWRDSGLLPFNSDVVLSKLKKAPTSSSRSSLISRPSTLSEGTTPAFDFATPPFVNPLPTCKTPHCGVEVTKLLQELKDGRVEREIAVEKIAKSALFSFAKMTITDSQNEDLVKAANETHKKRNKQAGNLGKARSMGGKIEGPRALAQAERDEFNKRWQRAAGWNRSDDSLGFFRIADDIYTWEISSQRGKKSTKATTSTTSSNPSNSSILPSLRTPIAPSKRPVLPTSQPPVLSPIKLPTRSVLRTPTPTDTPQRRRLQKLTVRRKRAQQEEIKTPKEIVTHKSLRSGRTVFHKSRD